VSIVPFPDVPDNFLKKSGFGLMGNSVLSGIIPIPSPVFLISLKKKSKGEIPSPLLCKFLVSSENKERK